MPLRGEGTDEQNPRYRILHLVQHCIEVRAGYFEISGMLRKLVGKLNPLHGRSPIGRLSRCEFCRRSLHHAVDDVAKQFDALKEIRFWTDRVDRILQ
jgi:hypothetical protein